MKTIFHSDLYWFLVAFEKQPEPNWKKPLNVVDNLPHSTATIVLKHLWQLQLVFHILVDEEAVRGKGAVDGNFPRSSLSNCYNSATMDNFWGWMDSFRLCYSISIKCIPRTWLYHGQQQVIKVPKQQSSPKPKKLPPPCLTVGVRFSFWNAGLVLHQMWRGIHFSKRSSSSFYGQIPFKEL